jgi:hypothetical protein
VLGRVRSDYVTMCVLMPSRFSRVDCRVGATGFAGPDAKGNQETVKWPEYKSECLRARVLFD